MHIIGFDLPDPDRGAVASELAAAENAGLGWLSAGRDRHHPGRALEWAGPRGLGAAWYEWEHGGLGVPFPPTAERFERLEQALQICLQMWDPLDNGPFVGSHYQLAETVCVPAPASLPHAEIMVGGNGERRHSGWSPSTPMPAT
ncbi:LLM class oxidoreductase [Phytohabitans suffuscus]|uniref:hypothetical protein n=1 Tax=Phytohabitans suffuscus TaxID=624315 RepID=UPI0015D44BD3|nr:hypothetical protein [Phytohabitans suffuscus]